MFGDIIGVTTVEITTFTTLFLAAASVIFNAIAGFDGLPRQRWLHRMISVISLFYVGGYIWLIFFTPDRASWSEVMVGFSLLAWVFVWIGPAYLSIRLWRELHAALEERLKEEN